MKILCIIPPYVPSYFNAGHHLSVFLVGAYLQEQMPAAQVRCVDGAALNLTWKDVCSLLEPGFDVIALLADFDGVDGFGRFLRYVRTFTPHARVITFGRLAQQIPRFFFQFDIDAVVASGDAEAGVYGYVKHDRDAPAPAGVLLRGADSATPGFYLPAQEWVLPDVEQIPYAAYSGLYRNDLNKFCGIPERTELVVPVARGCPIGCSYCDVPPMQGLTERRISVEQTVSYIVDAFAKLPFEYVSFYAPTFTLNRKWVLHLCDALASQPRRYPWKCVTVLKLLDRELLERMAASGCVRVSVGIETFSAQAANSLPRVKQDVVEQFEDRASMCLEAGIELNCFLMLGLPGDSPAGIRATMEVCRKYEARVRPTVYTPYHRLHEGMTVEQVSTFDRQLFVSELVTEDDARAYYRMFHGHENDRATRVMERIHPAEAD